MLFQNDQGGKVLEDIYVPMFKQKGIEYRLDYFEPGTKDFSAVLAKIGAWKPDFLFPSYATPTSTDIVRQRPRRASSRSSFLVRGSLGPGLKNKDAIDDYMVYVPKYFEEAEKEGSQGRQVREGVTRTSTSATSPTTRRPSARPPATTTSTCWSRP